MRTSSHSSAIRREDTGFYKDAKFRRITRYRYNNVPMDNDGRYFYIKDGDTVWNPGFKPCRTPLDFYECRHGMNYTRITGQKKRGGGQCALLRAAPQVVRGAEDDADEQQQRAEKPEGVLFRGVVPMERGHRYGELPAQLLDGEKSRLRALRYTTRRNTASAATTTLSTTSTSR